MGMVFRLCGRDCGGGELTVHLFFCFITAQTSARCAELASINRKTDALSVRESLILRFE